MRRYTFVQKHILQPQLAAQHRLHKDVCMCAFRISDFGRVDHVGLSEQYAVPPVLGCNIARNYGGLIPAPITIISVCGYWFV